MIKSIDVYLITGFLGSGKTSCLNHIVKNIPSDIKTMILMNEFGAVGIDGVLVETAELNVLEINKGSIFCACAKTDFIKALVEIAVDFRPDVLFIEATGVANPTDIRRDLKLPFFKGAFAFQIQLCLIDVVNFRQEFELFAAAEYQIRDADICLLNKCDLVNAEQKDKVAALIRRYNSKTTFCETTLGQIDFNRVFPVGLSQSRGCFPMEQSPTQAELDAMMQGMLMDLSLSLNPPDNLVSAVYKWGGGSGSAFMAAVNLFPFETVRAKALLKLDDSSALRFDWVLGEYTLEACALGSVQAEKYVALCNHVVVLASPEVMQSFPETKLKAAGLAKMAE